MRWSMAALGCLVACAAHAQPAPDAERAADEAVLREQRLPTKGPELLQILRDRTPSEQTIRAFGQHVARLTAASYTQRIKAAADLTKMGPVVRPLLENHLRDGKTDAETAGRIRQVLAHFPPENDIAATSAAARMIARAQPANSLPVLLEFVPYATDESVRYDVQRAINVLAIADKKPVPLLVSALKDPHPARRAAAGEALLRGGVATKPQIEPLLSDPHPLVRYQVGMALVEKHDKRGLALLIAALADSSPERAETALDLLRRAAGEHAPDIYYESKHNASAVRDAWLNWHKKHHADLDLAKQFAKSDLGYTIISTTIGTKVNGKNKVFEIGPAPDHLVHWYFDAQRAPIDVQIIGPNRLLVAEYYARRVTERDFKGEVLKNFSVVMPVACQRLPNGHTFVASRRQLVIFNREGIDVFTWFPQNLSIITAQRLRNGQMAVVSSGGLCQLLDPQGRELKSFQMNGTIYTLGGNIEVLPNGRVLAPLYDLSVVVEFDWAGNKLWSANVSRPTSVTRLSNGNTLVTCMFDNQVVEINANGKEVWSYQTDGRPMRARRR